jgi:L-serine dehydratase
MSFHSITELFQEADAKKCSPGEIVCREEAERSELSYQAVWDRMAKTIPIFIHAMRRGLADTRKSQSGMVGGDGNRIYRTEPLFMSPVCHRALAYAVAAAESNAKMCRIVACPTAGSCGIVPAVLAAVGESRSVSEKDYTRALFTAGGIGEVIAEKAMIAGAVGGCQAECGSAVAMAAAAAVDLCRGTTEQMSDAISLGLKNILGLVCDPVGGLVEVPCVKRNGFHAVHTLVAVEMAMAGVHSVIPPDDVIAAMGEIGHLLPKSLRETSRAGLAVTETGKKWAEEISKQNQKSAK